MTTAPVLTERRLRIRDGLHFTAVQGEGVLLDLLEDRYWGLYDVSATIWKGLCDGLDRARLLARLGEAHGLPAENAAETLDAQLATWARCRLLLADEEDGGSGRPRVAAKPAGEPAREDLGMRAAESPGLATAGKGPVLLRAAWWAARRLKRGRLDDALAELASGGAWDEGMQPDVLRTVVAYHRLRRWFFRQDDCLPRTLTLARALQLQGIPSDVCFGVRKIPLQAHAWLEVGGVSALDSAGHLAPFSVLARF